jgi:transcriptional regulator with XRE-family HTH domain
VSSSQVQATGPANIIGQRLRELRHENRWTLTEVAKRTGISIGTLSKLENGKTDLNFTSVNKLASGLGLRVTDLTNPGASVSGHRTLTRASSGTVFTTPDVDYEILCSEISNARQGYLRGRVKAHSIDPTMPWHRHKGQEFIYVLSGTLELHTELYEPAVLKAGDSILFDSSMGHHYVSRGRSDAQILITMSLEGYENVADTLRQKK